MPSVTVLMPVFNAERYVRPAIDSILAQTHRDFEFLIINDGSTDGSRHIVASYRDPRIKLVNREQNQGLAAALNHGLTLAQGEFLARQDADDVSSPTRLERQMRFFRDHPEVGLLGTQGHLIDEAGASIGVVDRSLEHASICWYQLFDNPFIHTSVMFRRSAIMSIRGAFEATLDGYCEDFAVWSRILAIHRVGNLPERLVSYRVLPSSLTATLQDRAPSDPSRMAFATRFRQVIERNLRTMFPNAGFSETDAAMVSRFVLGLDRTSIDSFISLYCGLLHRFQELYPEASDSRDFRRTLARQIDALAYRVVPPSRSLALRVYVKAVRNVPSVLLELSWARPLSLILLGRAGRRRLARLPRSRAAFGRLT